MGMTIVLTMISFIVSIAQQQVYDDALELVRGAYGLQAQDTSVTFLGFASADVTRQQMKGDILPKLGWGGHGFCRFIACPIIAIASFYTNELVQAVVLLLLITFSIVLLVQCRRGGGSR